MQLYTIGHSTHPIDKFIQLLNSVGVTHLVDVRAYPTSRRMPWFSQDALQSSLVAQRIQYIHMPALGGRRKVNKDSINTGLRSAGFRAYADYMQTPLFAAALQHLNKLLKPNTCICIMCAEVLPWKCHRFLISDAEAARGIQVFHIMPNSSVKQHELSKFACIDAKQDPLKVFYPKSSA